MKGPNGCSYRYCYSLVKFGNSNGAHDRTRTGDHMLTMHVLYQLSYAGSSLLRFGLFLRRASRPAVSILERETGVEPATFSLEG